MKNFRGPQNGHRGSAEMAHEMGQNLHKKQTLLSAKRQSTPFRFINKHYSLSVGSCPGVAVEINGEF